MKKRDLFLGFAIGITTGILLTVMLISQRATANHVLPKYQSIMADASKWPDSLDAVIAAPGNHKIVYENDKIRILEVTGAPYVFEPIHTHKWSSVMWSANPNFAKAHLIYYNYGFDSVKKIYFIKDSVLEQGPPANKGFPIPPEGLHAVKNLSNLDILAYRVEFKN
jgi:hypothetical protein